MLYKENEFHGFDLTVQSLHITDLCYDGSLLLYSVIYSIIGLTRFQGVCVSVYVVQLVTNHVLFKGSLAFYQECSAHAP